MDDKPNKYELINSKDNLCKQSCEISVHIPLFL